MALPTPHNTQLRHRTQPRCLASLHNTWGWYLQRGLLQVRTANVFRRWVSHLRIALSPLHTQLRHVCSQVVARTHAKHCLVTSSTCGRVRLVRSDVGITPVVARRYFILVPTSAADIPLPPRSTCATLRVELSVEVGFAAVFARLGAMPTLQEYDVSSVKPGQQTLELPCVEGGLRYIVGVFVVGKAPTVFRLSAFEVHQRQDAHRIVAFSPDVRGTCQVGGVVPRGVA